MNEIRTHLIDEQERLRGRLLELIVSWGSGQCRQQWVIGTLVKAGFVVTTEQFKQAVDFLEGKGLLSVDRGHAYWLISQTALATEIVQRTQPCPSGIQLENL